MAGFRHNIHPNIKQGLDARVKAISEYAGQELRSSLLAESQASEDFVLTREGQVSKNCYIRMISPGTRKTNIIYGMFNIDDARITGEVPGADGGEDYFQSLGSRVKGAADAFYDTVPNKGHDHPHQQQVSVPGIRPIAGINNVSVEYTGYGGAVRKATINWTCFTLEQLEMYQKGSFLSSGQNIILDFGWVRSQKPSGRAGDIPKFMMGEGQHAKINQDLFKDTIDIVDGVERKTVDAQWDKLEIEYFGDWSGLIGPITKFTWAQRSDGGFDCVTEMISRGSNIFDKSLTALQNTPPELKTFPVKQPTFEEFADELIKDVMTKDGDNNDNYGVGRQFTKEFSLPDRIASLDIEILMKYFKNYLDKKDDQLELNKGVNVAVSFDKNVVAILRDTGKDGSDRPVLFEKELDNDGEETQTLKRARDFSNEIWVRWGWFEDNIVSFYTRSDKSDGKVLADFRSLDRVGGAVGQLRSVKIKNDPELYTYDPSKFILPGQFPSSFFAKVGEKSDTKSAYRLLAESIEAEVITEDRFLFATDDKKTEGYLRNVYINLNQIKSVFSTSGATIQSSMIKLANVINGDVKLWNFTIDKADNITGAISTFRVVAEQSSEGAETGDAADTSPKNSYVFDNFGFNSLVKDISLQSTIPDKFAITAGFTGARQAGEKDSNEDAISKYFKDGTDDVDEDKFKAAGEFFQDPANIGLFQVKTEATKDPDYGNPFEFAHIEVSTPELSKGGLSHSAATGPNGDRWSHTIPPILEKVSSNAATTKFLDQFKKKHEQERRKLETKAWQQVKAGKAKAEDISNLFMYDVEPNGQKVYRMPYNPEGEMIESFKRAMKWFLTESPLTRFSANNQGPLTMPINIDMTIEGCGGIYPGDMFRLSYLPEIYGQVDYSIRKPAYVKPNDIMPKTYFSVMGLTHTISSDGWDTQITAVTNKSKDDVYEEEATKKSRDIVRQVYKEKISNFIKAEPDIPPIGPPAPIPQPAAGGAPPGPPPVNDSYPAPAEVVIIEPDDQIKQSIFYDPAEEDSYHRIGDSNSSFSIGNTTLFEYDNLDDFMNPDKTLDVNRNVFEETQNIGRATRFPGRPRGSGGY
jgi:hypothetical protein|tara:strand:+ start:11539 stop:14805 length:3267 start_codon:yes stop_codon:yes gene_type:complete